MPSGKVQNQFFTIPAKSHKCVSVGDRQVVNLKGDRAPGGHSQSLDVLEYSLSGSDLSAVVI